MREIGEGLYPEETRVIVKWNETHPTETPIRIQHGYVQGSIHPGESVIVPANVAAFLIDESGYNVALIGEVTSDAELEDAVADVELQAKAKALIAQSVDKLKDGLADADLATLRAALAAENAEGEGKTRSTAIAAIEEAIKNLEQSS